jgi:hypothetical protein
MGYTQCIYCSQIIVLHSRRDRTFTHIVNLGLELWITYISIIGLLNYVIKIKVLVYTLIYKLRSLQNQDDSL